MTIDVAVVGCGHMGRHHARVVSASKQTRLVAAIDIVDERAAAVAEQFHAAVGREVPEGVEAVIIATPTATHSELVARHLRAGRWVLCEKPVFAASVADTLRLAGAPTRRLAVGHVERFNPAVRALGARRPSSVIGRREVLRTPRNRDIDTARDLLVHDLDLALWWGQGQPRIDRVEQGESRVAVDLDVGGLRASLVANREATEPVRSAVIETASGQRLQLDYLAGTATDLDSGAVLPPVDDLDGLTAQWLAFIDAVQGRRPIAVDYEDALAALLLAERVSATLPSETALPAARP